MDEMTWWAKEKRVDTTTHRSLERDDGVNLHVDSNGTASEVICEGEVVRHCSHMRRG